MLTVASILKNSPELNYLSRYVQPGSPPPPNLKSIVIWKFVVATLLAIAAGENPPKTISHETPVSQLKHIHEFMEKLQLSDKNIIDLLRPSQSVWQRQIIETNEILELMEETRSRVELEAADFLAEIRKGPSMEHDILEEEAEHARLNQQNLGSRPNIKAKLTQLSTELAAMEVRGEQLTNQDDQLVSRETSLNADLAHLSSRFADLQSKFSAIKKVEQHDLDSIEADAEKLAQEVHSNRAALLAIEEYQRNCSESFTILTNLDQKLEHWIKLKNDAISKSKGLRRLQDEEQSLKNNHKSLSEEIGLQLEIITNLKHQTDEAKEIIAQREKQIAELDRDLVGQSSVTPQLGIKLTNLQKRSEILEKEQSNLVTSLKAQRKWLRNFSTLKEKSIWLENQHKLLNQWVREFSTN